MFYALYFILSLLTVHLSKKNLKKNIPPCFNNGYFFCTLRVEWERCCKSFQQVLNSLSVLQLEPNQKNIFSLVLHGKFLTIVPGQLCPNWQTWMMMSTIIIIITASPFKFCFNTEYQLQSSTLRCVFNFSHQCVLLNRASHLSLHKSHLLSLAAYCACLLWQGWFVLLGCALDGEEKGKRVEDRATILLCF